MLFRSADIPKLLGLYREGQLDLDGLVTKTYSLDGVNDGYDDMRSGKNIRGVMYEPLVGAAAHALATVFDRVRHGSLPGTVRADAEVQHAALLAANVAAKPTSWAEFREQLHRHATDTPKALTLAAIALGWTEKWR